MRRAAEVRLTTAIATIAVLLVSLLPLVLVFKVHGAVVNSTSTTTTTTTSTTMVIVTTNQNFTYGAPPGNFQGQPLGTPQVSYEFDPGMTKLAWTNHVDSISNIQVETLLASDGGLPVPVSGSTEYGNTSLSSNGGAITYKWTRVAGAYSGTFWLTFKQVYAFGNANPNLKVVINGTQNQASTLYFVFSGSHLCSKNGNQLLLGSVGMDYSDSLAFSPSVSGCQLTFAAPSGAFAIDPTTIATSTQGLATANSGSTKMVTCNGQHLSFFSDGTNVVYYSSTDGSTWTSQGTATSAVTSSQGSGFSVAVGGTNKIVYSIVANDGSSAFHYRDGTCNADGTISWARTETAVATANSAQGIGSTAYDGTNIGVAAITNGGGNYKVEVLEGAGGGSFTNRLTITWGASATDAAAILTKSTSGLEIVYPSTTGASYETLAVSTAAWNSGTWSGPFTTAKSYYLLDTSCASSGDQIDCAGLTNSGGNSVWFFEVLFAGTGINRESTTGVNTYQDASLATDGSTFVVAYGQTSTVAFVSSTNSGAAWSAANTVSTTETSFQDDSLNCDPVFVSPSFICEWVQGSTPFNVRTALSSLPVTEQVTLTIAPVGASNQGAVTISGCSPSSSTIAIDGAQHSFTALGGCSLTFTVAADGASVRDRFSPLSNTWAYTTAATGTETKSNTVYHQVTNTYTAVASPSTWDSGYALSVTATNLGAAGTTICIVSAVSGASSNSCSAYADLSSTASLPASFADVSAGTWTASGSYSFVESTGGNVHSVNYALIGNGGGGGGNGVSGGGGGAGCPAGYSFGANGGCVLSTTTSGSNLITSGPDFGALGVIVIVVVIGGFVAFGTRKSDNPFNGPSEERKPRY